MLRLPDHPPLTGYMTRSRFLLAAYFCLLTTIVFATQFSYAGFYDKHHGWVTSHGLAIAVHATPANGFVGHARLFVEPGGALDQDYFDRYPLFYSAALGALIRLSDDLETQVFIARQLMHALFALALLFAWRLLRLLGATPVAALVGVTLAFSGYGLLYYRGMVHFDQPALPAMLALLCVIARAKLERRQRWRRLTLTTLVVLALGRGLASLGVLGLWFALESAGLLWQREQPLRQRLRAILRQDATRLLLLGLVWSVLLLSWNLAHEMARRNVPLEQTGIVYSMTRRLPLGHEGGRNLSTGKNAAPPWDEFATRTVDRVLRWYAPLSYAGSDDAPARLSWPLFLLMLATVSAYVLRQRPPLRLLLLLVAGSGLLFITFMINLTAHHDFTTLYAIGFALVFWLAALAWLRSHPRLTAVALVLALLLFARSALLVEAENRAIFAEYARYTAEYNRIRLALESRGVAQARIYDIFINHCPIHHSKCYAPGFLLQQHAIAEKLADADFVLSDFPFYPTRPWLPPEDSQGLQLLSRSLTPENDTYHLFATADFEPRHLPPGIAPRYRFAGELALGHWELRDDVRARPCQRIQVESWWQALDPPAANYSIQLALTNAAGDSSVAAANDRLTTVYTGVWGPDAWFLDARTLQIPCDAPPGDYPLVLSVYDPLTLATRGALPLVDADGVAGDTWLYLTTLFVTDG